MWIDKGKKQYNEIPQRWVYNGKIIELAKDPCRAKRFGWTEDLTSIDENTVNLYTMENLYLETTKKLIILAGKNIEENDWQKLEDEQFIIVRKEAIINNITEAIELLDTLNYSFTQIIRYGGTWDKIKYHIN